MVQLDIFSVWCHRGIVGLFLPRLSKANLITGANGGRKTALIEAMWLFAGRFNPGLLWNINLQRTQTSLANPVSRINVRDAKLQSFVPPSRSLESGLLQVA